MLITGATNLFKKITDIVNALSATPTFRQIRSGGVFPAKVTRFMGNTANRNSRRSNNNPDEFQGVRYSPVEGDKGKSFAAELLVVHH